MMMAEACAITMAAQKATLKSGIAPEAWANNRRKETKPLERGEEIKPEALQLGKQAPIEYLKLHLSAAAAV
ncbi:hypothetical protein DXT99_21750 [Pontibacter diazotrophicus]|uniref:Uncharacterized protein n=1 Tax=Pontibacter diazotrophicus TaxID=1400979 RepID=A0A3D8L6G8_9BACT|nr:hypothetical protein DXT99_21750 [Pontibacter diazotrophicus]